MVLPESPEGIVRAGAIILMCIFAAVVYGILHDLVTAHVCVEYFTIGHPPVFHTDNPIRLALGWGVMATWWVGLGLGVGLARAAVAGSYPPRGPRSLVCPISILLLVCAVSAATMGLIGYWLAESGWVMVDEVALLIPCEKRSRFMADWWAHTTSYGVGLLGGLVVMVRVWRGRCRANDRATGDRSLA
jgi:hypothetical protein